MKHAKVRYAVVGLGWFAQDAILPAFAKARNSELVALVSGNPQKLHELADRYSVERRASYQEYQALLESGTVDAVYIALPNSMHCEYAEKAARAAVHVLCEKPMAMNERECWTMIHAADQAQVKLMVAYRLHFEKANLTAIESIKHGRIGDARFLNSTFAIEVKAGNTRLDAGLSAGPLYDVGIYCINAARNLFGAEPSEVVALSARRENDARFAQVEEQLGAIMRFPGERLATFVVSFGANGANRFEVIGTEGRITLENAYSHDSDMRLEIASPDAGERRLFKARDQVTPEIIYFSDCIREDRDPEPSGREGLADVRVINALQRSQKSGHAEQIAPIEKEQRPGRAQEITIAASEKPELIGAEPSH